MAVLNTSRFGAVEYEENAVLLFPRGLPGFEQRRRFLPISLPERNPLVFLQSLEDPALCFPTLPVRVIDPEYRLEMSREDIALVGLRPGAPWKWGEDILCLAVISIRPEGSTANLMAPLVVNLRNLRGVQAVSPAGQYSHRQPLAPAGASVEATPC